MQNNTTVCLLLGNAYPKQATCAMNPYHATFRSM